MSPRPQRQGGFSSGLAPKPVQVLYGHDAEVTCVAISTELDMAVSGSKVSWWGCGVGVGRAVPLPSSPRVPSLPQDGTIITHTVRRGLFIRSLRPPGESCPPAVLSHLAVGPEGQVVAQTAVGQRSCSKVRPGVPVSPPATTTTTSTTTSTLPLCPFQERFALHLYSVNGKLLSSVPLDREVTAMCLTEDFVVLGTSECGLEIRELQR